MMIYGIYRVYYIKHCAGCVVVSTLCVFTADYSLLCVYIYIYIIYIYRNNISLSLLETISLTQLCVYLFIHT